MNTPDFFELNSWGLTVKSVRLHAAAAFSHSSDSVFAHPVPKSWPSSLVDPCHLFACGTTRSGGMVGARRALELLLEQGARLDAIDASGWTPLAYAAWFGLSSTLDILLEAGASVHPEGAPPPLTIALSSVAQRQNAGSETCARLLLMSGAEPLRCSISEAMGRTSFLSWALSNSDLSWANLLHARGDRLRNDREISVLTWQAEADALDWMQIHGYDVLSRLPFDHAHREALALAQSERRRHALSEQIPAARRRSPDTDPSSIEGEDGSARQL